MHAIVSHAFLSSEDAAGSAQPLHVNVPFRLSFITPSRRCRPYVNELMAHDNPY